jgi:hypothetical protein
MQKCPQTTAWRCRRQTHRNEQISPNPKLISKIKIHGETWTNNSQQSNKNVQKLFLNKTDKNILVVGD